jgi:hypothetical protein
MTGPINTGMSDYSLHKYWVANECPQKYSYIENLGLNEPERDGSFALPFGTAVHFLLANHYAGKKELEGVEDLDLNAAGQVLDAKELVDEYKIHYRFEQVEVVAVETQVIINIGDHKLSRRLDLLIRKDSRLFVMDHKSAYRPQQRLWEAKSDPSLYSQEIVVEASGLAEQYGLSYGGFILNVIGKNKDDGPARFVRKKISWRQEWKNQFPELMMRILEIPKKFAHLDPWEWPRSGRCMGRWGPCGFHDLCIYGQSVLGKYL